MLIKKFEHHHVKTIYRLKRMSSENNSAIYITRLNDLELKINYITENLNHVLFYVSFITLNTQLNPPLFQLKKEKNDN